MPMPSGVTNCPFTASITTPSRFPDHLPTDLGSSWPPRHHAADDQRFHDGAAGSASSADHLPPTPATARSSSTRNSSWTTRLVSSTPSKPSVREQPRRRVTFVRRGLVGSPRVTYVDEFGDEARAGPTGTAGDKRTHREVFSGCVAQPNPRHIRAVCESRARSARGLSGDASCRPGRFSGGVPGFGRGCTAHEARSVAVACLLMLPGSA
jgi:hypothetical protein